MKETRPRIKKARKEPTRKGHGPNHDRISIPWGRGASEYRPGLFTKRYLEEHGEALDRLILGKGRSRARIRR